MVSSCRMSGLFTQQGRLQIWANCSCLLVASEVVTLKEGPCLDSPCDSLRGVFVAAGQIQILIVFAVNVLTQMASIRWVVGCWAQIGAV